MTLSVLSIAFSLALWCWRVGHLRRMHMVGYDLTEREDVVDDEDDGGEQQMNPLNQLRPSIQMEERRNSLPTPFEILSLVQNREKPNGKPCFFGFSMC